MIRHITLAVLLAAAPLAAQTSAGQARQAAPPATAAAAVPAALKALQGTWVLTTADGQPLSQGGELVLVITGDKYVQSVGGTVNERGTIKLDATKKPTWIDLTITDGDDAGKHQVGLIEVTGAMMKGVLSPAGVTARPTSLTPTPDVIPFVAKKK